MRVVLDANVIVSAALPGAGPPVEIVHAWDAGRFEVITSAALLAEAEEVLFRPRILARAGRERDRLDRVLRLLRGTARLVEPSRRLDVVSADPDDDRVIEAAVEGKADYIVTGDGHLLSLGSFEGVAIVTPTAFLAILEPERP